MFKQIQIDTDKEIVLQKQWLEGLLEYAKDTRKELDSKRTFKLYALLGYISSAETILKLDNLKK